MNRNGTKEESKNHGAGKKMPFFKMKQLFLKINSGKYHRLLNGVEQRILLLIINHLSKT